MERRGQRRRTAASLIRAVVGMEAAADRLLEAVAVEAGLLRVEAEVVVLARVLVAVVVVAAGDRTLRHRLTASRH